MNGEVNTLQVFLSGSSENDLSVGNRDVIDCKMRKVNADWNIILQMSPSGR